MNLLRDILILFCAVSFVSPVYAVQIIKSDIPTRTCYECSIEYAQAHPEYGIVTMSYNQYFQGISHMVNYKLMSDDSLEIHDGFWGADYILYDWLEDERFMHFWINETPVRSYKFLQDNKEELYNYTE